MMLGCQFIKLFVPRCVCLCAVYYLQVQVSFKNTIAIWFAIWLSMILRLECGLYRQTRVLFNVLKINKLFILSTSSLLLQLAIF
jgi:hypothetical protein